MSLIDGGPQRSPGGMLESEPEFVTDQRDSVSLHLDIDHERVAELCRRNPTRRLALFGSVLRDDFGPRSDVGVLVELTPQTRVTLLDMVRMQDELSAIIGRGRGRACRVAKTGCGCATCSMPR